MKWSVQPVPAGAVQADALVVFLHRGETAPVSPGYRSRSAEKVVPPQWARAVAEAVSLHGFNGSEASVALHADSRSPVCPRVVLAGLGPRERATGESVRRAAGAATARAADARARTVAYLVPGDPAGTGHAIIEAAEYVLYRFERYRSEKSPPGPRQGVLLTNRPRGLEEEIRRSVTHAEAVNFARTLVDEPPAAKTPRRLAEIAREIGRLHRGALKVVVWDEKRIERERMGAIRGVSLGSVQPPRFVHMTYAPARARRTLCLLGKGITFDAGGLGLKTAEGMLDMKYDMSGAATVLAVMNALPVLRPPVRVHGIFAATENMPGPAATKFRDVLRARNGTTIEVTHPDAEGRLILADMLSYCADLKPDAIVDCATLTGAMRRALGVSVMGILGTDDALVEEIMEAAREEDEPMWRMPLVEDYREYLKSEVADIRNTGPTEGGAITAALFLREFVPKGVPWAHVDFAGPALNEKPKPWMPFGATGCLVRTLLRMIEQTTG